MKNPYDKLLARKRKWSPVQTTAGKLKPGAEETIFRALAIRHMELPVGEFIEDALGEVPDHARDLLRSNVKDEENHDLALGYVVNALGVDEEAEKEALRLRAAWEAHPDHTITKALVAERAIFFVLLPFFRFNGDAGLRTVSADISRDEQILQPLGRNTTDKYLDRKFWTDSSDRLMYEGKAPELSDTKRARMPAFFEHANTNLPKYA